MSRHTILLGVDGALLVEIDSPARDYAAYREGRDYTPLPVPNDAEVLPDGRFFFRPAVMEGLRELAAAGTDIVWNTRRLADPTGLRSLAAHLGLTDAVRFPDATELPARPTDTPVDIGANVLWDHWKVQALIHRVRDLAEGDEVVVIDATLDFSAHRMPDGLARRAGRKDAATVGGITTPDVRGLRAHEVELLRGWVAGGPVPRV